MRVISESEVLQGNLNQSGGRSNIFFLFYLSELVSNRLLECAVWCYLHFYMSTKTVRTIERFREEGALKSNLLLETGQLRN